MPQGKEIILVVDDDIRIQRMMKRILELEDYQVVVADNDESALLLFTEQEPAIVLLDIMMPLMDGYEVCQRIREHSQTPIIMVTAKRNEEEKVKGFDVGADDYITKPFSSLELVARVKSVLRRTILWDERPEPSFRSDGLVIDFADSRVFVDDEEVNLTTTEYRIVSYLASNVNMVLTLDQIMSTVWGDDYVGETHLLQVNITRLRRKLKDDPTNPKYIVTKSGICYMMIGSEPI